jgi:hypothetical protein
MDEVIFIVKLAFMTSILPNKRISYLRILSILSIFELKNGKISLFS